jgi:hypothetical protein
MSAPPPLSDREVSRTREEIRGPEIGSAPKRERLLQRVRAARKRLSPIPQAVPRLR